MTTFAITLGGDTSVPDDARDAFETAVRSLRESTPALSGSLTLDGVPYDVEGVSDEPPGTGDDDQSTEPGE